jgi:hypothetical protein
VLDDGSNIFGSIKNMNSRLVLVRIGIRRVNSKIVRDSLALGFIFTIVEGEREEWGLLGRRCLSRNVSDLHG